MAHSPFAFTPVEQVAIEAIREERPAVLASLSEGLAPVLEDLSETCQGRVVTEADAEDLVDRPRAQLVSRTMAEMEPWDEDEDLRGTVVELLARHLLAGAREEFVRRVVGMMETVSAKASRLGTRWWCRRSESPPGRGIAWPWPA